MDTLDTLRKKIDRIDEDLISLLTERMKTAIEIGVLKSTHDIAILDKSREAVVFDRLKPFEYSESLHAIYTTILSESKKLQGK